ncbi:hypothetical protein LSCM1_00511 [Leishmania martiniquensis]|uniref:200 kDa antigen p200 n=1 Tax=Leishmania martiniquensis TaxID=1580590 RepID=A0A836K5Z8_9TRYP|nr:hypothetical protein LSCM1_00511 [Leishmania martiniquensis]
MLSESDESTYTVHEVHSDECGGLARPGKSQEEEGGSPPLARYHRLGTKERHAFDEHMRLLRQQATAAERERQFRMSHPFQPKIRTSSPAAGGELTAEAQVDRQSQPVPPVAADTGTSSSPSSVRPVFDRLAAQAVQLEMRRRHREEQQRRAEAAALRGAFQPHINHSAPIYAERLRHLDSVPVEVRLLQYGEFVARERQRRQEMNELEKTKAWQSAEPSLMGASAAHTHDPEERRQQQEAFEERNVRFLEERAKHRECARAAAAEAFSFQPKISVTSAALDEARQRLAKDVGASVLGQLLNRSLDTPALSISKTSTNAGHRSDALYALAVTRQRQKQQNLDGNGPGVGSAVDRGGNDQAVEGPSTSHQPLTNPTSDKWIAKGAHGPFFQENFVRRQALYEEVKREEAALRAVAVQAPASSNGESVAHKVNSQQLNQRLYYSAKKAAEVAERRRKALANAHECPFRPQLSPGTKYVLQRMPSRDGDVVKRLTTQCSKSAPDGTRTVNDADLYACAPAHRTSSQGHAQVSSQQQTDETKSPPHVEAAPSEKMTPPHTASRWPKGGGVRAEGPGDALLKHPQEQQPKKRRQTLTRDEVDHFYERQMAALQRRQDLIQERKEGEVVQELVECTFRPRTNTDRHGHIENEAEAAAARTVSVNHVTGVSEFLERQALARIRKAEHDELVRSVGLPRNKCAGGKEISGGTTILSPFKFQTELRRSRSSCLPARASTSPLDSKQHLGTASLSMAALTSAERALHEAIEETRCYPRATLQAPLAPLPGYVQGSVDAKYFDGPYDGAPEERKVGETAPPVPLATLPAESKRRVDAATFGSGCQRPSLFSLISPNTFSGCNLDSVVHDCRGRKDSSLGRDLAGHQPSPSALKGARQHPTTNAARHRRTRSVSFAEDTAGALHARSSRGARTSFADPAHQAFLQGQL